MVSLTKYRSFTIRLSISYLFRIKLDDKYLLIQSARFPDQFNPVGGVFKRLPSSQKFFTAINAKPDDKILEDEVSHGDLRFRIEGKYIPHFLNWFDKAIDRELSPWREFYEELVEPNILSKENFPYIFYNYVSRHQLGISYNDFFDCHVLLIAEIFELVPTEAQKKELLSLSQRNDNRYIWADAQMIRRRGVPDQKPREFNISDHSAWIL